jgi:hypothetical protein
MSEEVPVLVCDLRRLGRDEALVEDVAGPALGGWNLAVSQPRNVRWVPGEIRLPSPSDSFALDGDTNPPALKVPSGSSTLQFRFQFACTRLSEENPLYHSRCS